ncbi:WD40 repeat-containing protein [Artemisia annua]|uniref:WD40 repeat-containing protein n=1 Tax=Artemisia annua TaxID=35608 RepID=A0A2U1L3X2_ARTAN|nr:WD40 repeat-containing protein [Artemisia annua]
MYELSKQLQGYPAWKQLKEALRSSMEGYIVPAFETSCKAMVDQVDATFQKGLQQQVNSTHSPLAVSLTNAINSASSMTRTLSSEVADGQRKLVALAVVGANSKTVGNGQRKQVVIYKMDPCQRAMIDQVDATFQKGLQQQVNSTHSPLVVSLTNAINSASSMTRTLSSEVADGQRKLVALAVAGANSKTVGSLMTQLSNGSINGICEMVEAPVDPTKELSPIFS